MRRIALALALTLASLPLGTPAQAATGFDSAYAFESAFLRLPPGGSGQLSVFFANTGTVSWTMGAASEVVLAICLPDQVTCNVVSPSSAWNPGSWHSPTAYAGAAKAIVAPGEQVAFTYAVRVPAEVAPGTYRFNGDLVVKATGEKVHPEGYYHDVTVVAPAPAPTPSPSPVPTTQPARNVQAFVGAYDGGATNNDVPIIFDTPASNGPLSYEVQRATGACPVEPASGAFSFVGSAIGSSESAGVFDLDRPAGTYCYQVRVRSGSTAAWAYSNQAVATVFGGSDASVPTSVSTTLVSAQGSATAVDAGDAIRIVFSKAMLISANASLGLTDADCGAPPSQSGPATCPSGQTQTRATIQCGTNATCVLSLDGKTFDITISAALTITQDGSVAGVQMPAMVTSATGINDANGAPWQLAQSADRTFGAGVGQ